MPNVSEPIKPTLILSDAERGLITYIRTKLAEKRDAGDTNPFLLTVPHDWECGE